MIGIWHFDQTFQKWFLWSRVSQDKCDAELKKLRNEFGAQDFKIARRRPSSLPARMMAIQ